MVIWSIFMAGALGAPSPGESAVAETVEVRAPRPLRSTTEEEFPVDRLFLPPLGSPQSVLESNVAVQTRSSGSGEGEWVIRGQDPVQSRFFIEGIPLSTALYQRARLTPVPWEAVGAVELTAGGIPAQFGSGGLGGAVNLQLTDPEDSIGVRGGQENRVHGGWGGSLPGHLEVQWGSGVFPYWDDGGTPLNPGDDRMARRGQNRFLQASFLPQWRRGNNQGFLLGHFSKRQVPGSIALPRPGQLEEGRVIVASRQRWSRGLSSRVHVRGEQSRWKDEGAFPSSVPNRVSGWGGGHDLIYTRGSLKMGWGVRGEEFWTDGRRQRAWTFPGFVQGSFWNDSVRPALLFAYADQRSGADGQTYVGGSPRVSFRRRFHPRWQARAAASYAYRFPSLGERFGAPPMQSPNPALRAERAWRGEVGLDGRVPLAGGNHQVSVTGFGQWSRDLVAYENNAQRETVAVNVGRSTLLGLEGNWRTTWKKWEGRVGVGVLDTVNQTPVSYWNGNRLPRRPRWSLRSALSWSPGNWHLEYRFSFSAGSYQDLANLQWAAGYGLHGAEVRWNSPVGTWALEARNLLDVIVVDAELGAFHSQSFASGFLGYPAPGRQVFLSWRTNL